MLQKYKSLILVSFPILFMIGLIPVIKNDYILTGVYIIITLIGQYLYRENHDLTIYISGFFFMIVSELFFISTGVETFERDSLFELMPIWLPFLWAYGFLVIKRAIHIIE